MNLIDTHCHIHESVYPLDAKETLERAHQAGVAQMICVGTSEKSSEEAVEFAEKHEGVYASIGVHPHETKDGWEKVNRLAGDFARKQIELRQASDSDASLHTVELALLKQSSRGQETPLSEAGQPDNVSSSKSPAKTPETKLVAVGEIGLDYFYNHSPRELQIEALEAQIDLALKHNLPVIFHVRDAFDDFWPIFDNFHGIRGELHSFTDSEANLQQGLERGLYVGVNGISTFTKDAAQKAMFAAIPLERMLLETDAPFLTPVPFRGKVNEPAFVRQIAEFHADMRNISVNQIADVTTANAQTLFNLS